MKPTLDAGPVPRIAIFGGTFDPIHKAHLRVAAEAADAYQLTKVLFVTAANPPHKQAGSATPFELRHRMVELACASDPRFEPSRLEEGEGKSYSILTIQKVRASLAQDDRLFFLIGADAFAEIGTWRKAKEVIAAVEFIVVSRPGYDYPVPEGARVLRLETLALPVSSSEIRRQIELGEDPEDVPEAVLRFIHATGLYSSAKDPLAAPTRGEG